MEAQVPVVTERSQTQGPFTVGHLGQPNISVALSLYPHSGAGNDFHSLAIQECNLGEGKLAKP